MIDISDADLKEMLAMREALSDIAFSKINITDSLNMPSFVMAFKHQGDKGGHNVTKFGQSLDPKFWAFIPADSMIGKHENPNDRLPLDPISFWRHRTKPYIIYKTSDGWAFIGKFDRDFAPPFNGQDLHVYDESGNKLWSIPKSEISNLTTDEKSIMGILSVTLPIMKPDFIKANILKDLKLQRKGKPKPSGKDWQIMTYEKIKEIMRNDSNLPRKGCYDYVDIWHIPADAPMDPSKINYASLLFQFQQIAEVGKSFYLLDNLKLLVDKEEDDED